MKNESGGNVFYEVYNIKIKNAFNTNCGGLMNMKIHALIKKLLIMK